MYAIRYDEDVDERTVKLLRMGHVGSVRYLGVMHQGIFKTPRAERVRSVRQLTDGHPCRITVLPTYRDELPPWPGTAEVVKVPQSTGKRTWTVDFRTYTCSCPERRVRDGMGYRPGQLGGVCPHLARALLKYLPADLDPKLGWTPDLREFLGTPTKTSIENLIEA